MTRLAQRGISFCKPDSCAATAALAIAVALMVAMLTQSALAQTLTVLHSFTGGGDGAFPEGVTRDSAGNLYGAASGGGYFGAGACSQSGCGVIFKLGARGWEETPIYIFHGSPDGSTPLGELVFGPDGALYGTTYGGGTSGSGTVFKLQPPSTFCRNVQCSWRETILYSFTGSANGASPSGDIVFDRAGNLYGTTTAGGSGPCQNGCGTVFKLTHNSDGTWSQSTLHSFQGGANDGDFPDAGLVIDLAGNLYGTTIYGGAGGCVNGQLDGCGTVFELSPSGSGWTESLLHSFTGLADGIYPNGVTLDGQGNLWGATPYDSTLFELTPEQGGGWNFSVQHTFGSGEPYGEGPVTLDAAGNIYGSSDNGGQYGSGAAYTLTNSSGGWILTTLASFNLEIQGNFCAEKVVLDAQGDVFGSCNDGYPGVFAGSVWEITP